MDTIVLYKLYVQLNLTKDCKPFITYFESPFDCITGFMLVAFSWEVLFKNAIPQTWSASPRFRWNSRFNTFGKVFEPWEWKTHFTSCSNEMRSPHECWVSVTQNLEGEIKRVEGKSLRGAAVKRVQRCGPPWKCGWYCRNFPCLVPIIGSRTRIKDRLLTIFDFMQTY